MNKEEWIRKGKIFGPILLVVGCIALFFWRQENHEETQQKLPPTLQAGKAETRTKPPEVGTEKSFVKVDVKGAVRHPGVYELKNGQRVFDAIRMAGGFTKQAQQRNVNLSMLLRDELLLYIPAKGEKDVPGVASAGSPSTTSASDGGGAGVMVHINSANEEELQKLNGVGPARAKAILAYRQEKGRFQKIEERMDVSGIGEKSLAKMKEQISLD
ncbi:competence protein ComEA helix-hairpin-helix repeat protein [Fictibacillus macauensis ZFHKF-1]|uniref:Competence protein ComEA helix-hairpin-helix repeat protein n=1 Tax=Fictibacillus macauensis ZFHKF-1 TaxID=1196324 RepID=I8UEA6_9BACL|nr:helix-hairpin-helix domain-containing protein [Fictibacillus macauensis]EIT85240.1 competence protein ComEA helix-hairpin-helix repeat protein [Fictibacillus macauensis ZFHKF-1]